MAQGKCIGLELQANMKDFLRINGDLFLRGEEGLLMKCVSRQEGLTILHRLHYDVCGVILDAWPKWPMMLRKNNGIARLVLLYL